MKIRSVVTMCLLLIIPRMRAIAADDETVVTWQEPEKIASFREAFGLTNIADRLFFRSNRHIWGFSEEKGKAVRAGTPGRHIDTMDVYGGKLYVAARSLYVLDNADGELRSLNVFLAGVVGHPAEFQDIRDTEMFFAADDGQHGMELWRTDGTVDGTQLVRDINRGGAGSCPKELEPAGNFLLFLADDGLHGAELWRSDGTRSGTVMLKDLLSGPPGFTILATQWAGERLYFNASGRGLCAVCATDGTPEGTRVLKRLSGNESSRKLAFSAGPNGIVFRYQDGLWFSSGTESSTRRIADLRSRRTSSGIAWLAKTVYILGKCTGYLDAGLWRIQADE